MLCSFHTGRSFTFWAEYRCRSLIKQTVENCGVEGCCWKYSYAECGWLGGLYENIRGIIAQAAGTKHDKIAMIAELGSPPDGTSE
jgi:hypothetical protein